MARNDDEQLSRDIADVTAQLEALNAKLAKMPAYRRESRFGKAQENARVSLEAQLERLKAKRLS
jgi:hypothetical protein